MVAAAGTGVDIAELVRAYEEARSASPSAPSAMVLVSFAMPAESLLRLVRDAGRVGVPLVLRGLVDNSVAETAKHLRDVDPAGIGTWLLDPRPFRELGIEGVPVFVVRRGKQVQQVRGDVSLDYALDIIVATGGAAWKLPWQ